MRCKSPINPKRSGIAACISSLIIYATIYGVYVTWTFLNTNIFEIVLTRPCQIPPGGLNLENSLPRCFDRNIFQRICECCTYYGGPSSMLSASQYVSVMRMYFLFKCPYDGRVRLCQGLSSCPPCPPSATFLIPLDTYSHAENVSNIRPNPSLLRSKLFKGTK